MSDELQQFMDDPPRGRRPDRTATKDPVLVPGLKPPPDQKLVWEPGEQEEWRKCRFRCSFGRGRRAEIFETDGWPGIVQEFQSGQNTHEASVNILFGYGPEELVRPLLPDWQPKLTGYSDFSILRIMPARFGLDARHVVFPNAKKHRSAWALMPWLDAETALLMADWLRTGSARDKAAAWFARHGAAAVPFLVPNALGGKRVPREKATAALALIVAAHGLPAVVEAARWHGDPAAEAIEHAFGDEAAPGACVR